MTRSNLPAWEQADPSVHASDPRAITFAEDFGIRPIPAVGPIDTTAICATPSNGFEQLWKAIEPETRTRANDIHLPIVVAYAERLCDAYPLADRELVLVAAILHDTGWAHVDESRIISEGFSGKLAQSSNPLRTRNRRLHCGPPSASIPRIYCRFCRACLRHHRRTRHPPSGLLTRRRSCSRLRPTLAFRPRRDHGF